MNTTVAVKFAKGFLPLFYLVPPNSSTFEHLEDVPDYLEQVIPYFFILIGLEVIVRWLQDKPLPRLNDSISSLTAGTSLQFGKLIIGVFEISSYVWVYNNLCLYKLSWNSVTTWWVTLLAYDFFYYWFHRMAHEINLFWAAHQVHHSSQDYTLSTALRQSVLQRFTSWFFYMPMALFIPPPVYLVHKQFNLLYQFWIHTEVIDKLGPLEWILNTPSHHRVHHGTNPYCIDKNYGGLLIVWDRLFGTFAAESEQVYYGLVHQPKTWNPVWAQFFYVKWIVKRTLAHESFSDALRFLFYAPSWSPGYGRMGFKFTEPYPPISRHLKSRFGKPTSWWLNIYVSVHFAIVLSISLELGKLAKLGMPYLVVLAAIGYLVLSLTNFGFMFDLRPVSSKIEVLRLAIFLLVDFVLIQQNHSTGLPVSVMRWICMFSIVLWSQIILKQVYRKREHQNT